MNQMGIIHRIGLVVMVLTLLSVASDNSAYKLNKNLAELAEVNEKLGVVAIHPINDTVLDKKNADFKNKLKASVLSVNEKRESEESKELLVDYSFDHSEDVYLVKVQNELPAEKIAEIYSQSTSLVGIVEPNYEIELATAAMAVSLDDLRSEFSAVAANKDHDFVPAPITVAVVDSGVDTSHKALGGKIIEAKSFVTDGDTLDRVGHGTHIAGIIAKEAPNARIMSLKFTDGKTGSLGNLLSALDYAVKNEADIINLSLGLREDSQLLARFIKSAIKNNIVVVAAAGNQNSSDKFYPAASDGVVSVAALDRTGHKLYSSNYGDWVDFSLRGQDIYSTYPHNRYKYWSGTSQAAASLSGKIATYASTPNSNLDLEEALKTLLESGETYTDEEGRVLGVKIAE